MSDVFDKIIPVVLVFICGFLLKKSGVLTKKDGETMLKLFFYVSVPPLIFLSVAQMNFSPDLLWLPVIAALVLLGTFGVSMVCRSVLNLDSSSMGAFLAGTLIMNTSFTFPFLIAVKGEGILALASLFDFGNTALVFTFVYFLACRYGSNSSNLPAMLKKFLCSPPLLALISALCLNLAHIKLPGIAVQFFKTLGYMTVPLVMLSLGILFSPGLCRIRPVLASLVIRSGGGLAIGYLLAYLFHLEGPSKTVVLVLSSAPSGLTTLVFSTLEELDSELAAGIVSYSVLLGMVLVPVLLHFSAA